MVAAGGRLSGRLIGTVTPGLADIDTVSLRSQTASLLVKVNGRNQGTIESAAESAELLVDFTSIESVITGSGNDTIVMGPGSALTDKLDAGDGARDFIDYSAWSSPVSIDLAANNIGTANKNIGSVYGIEDITGGSGPDQLTGNNLDNRIIGMGGGDTIRGWSVMMC